MTRPQDMPTLGAQPSETSAESLTQDLARLRQFIEERYNLDELHTLCFDWGVEYENLAGDTRSAKARELVDYMRRRDQLDRLVGMLHQTRPDAFVRAGLASIPVASLRSDSLRTCIKSYTFPFNEPYYPLPQREKEIQSVMQALHPGGRSTVMVTGLGGMGKTALAVEVARRCAQDATRPFQAITWESAKQELFREGKVVKIQGAVVAWPKLLDSLGRQLEGPDFGRKPVQEKERSLGDFLHTTPCLVVVDNLETMDNAQEIMLRLERLVGASRVLITSREAVPSDSFTMRLEGLPEENAIAFLRAEGRQRNVQEIAAASEDTLREIHRVTQGLPLAMKLVVGQVEILDLNVMLKKLASGSGDIYSFIFFETWQRLSDLAKKILLCMSRSVSAVSRQELEKVLKVEGEPLDQAIEQLVRLSLLIPQPLPGLRQRGYNIHQLTRYCIVNDLPSHWQ